ncbi:MAG: proline dehydrogenase family protein [Chlamydiota bacterium]
MSSRYSVSLQKAIEKIKEVSGKQLTELEREKKTIDLALDLLEASLKTKTWEEKKKQAELSHMMQDVSGKAFTTSMADQCFRSTSPLRIADQCVYLLNIFGIPKYLSFFKRKQLYLFRFLGPLCPRVVVPLLTFALRKETSAVILPAEPKALAKHIALRKQEGVQVNLNHLGEAILGEKEALQRLNVYLQDLASPNIEYISVKISTLFSQIHLIAWEGTLDILSDRLKQLYRAAMSNTFEKANGEKTVKFVNLDMEEYRDLHLTKELFIKVLSDPEFFSFSAGIVLQAYLPDCFLIQEELTRWAKERVSRGGAPIKIRIVKGANLAMEQFESSLRGWPQAPYLTKAEVDANYKKMVLYGCEKENAGAVHLGVATHNIFDMAYAILVRAENQVEEYVIFEMLEGMADHTRRVLQAVAKDVLLYCPVATKKEFSSAVAYLIRRLDENTGPENFLRYSFGLKVGSLEWKDQVERFTRACNEASTVFIGPRREQNREDAAPLYDTKKPFSNEPDTDFSLEVNRKWAQEIVSRWHKKEGERIPFVIGGEEEFSSLQGEGFDPSYPDTPSYQYSLANSSEVDRAIRIAKEEEAAWQEVSIEEKTELLAKVAQKLREHRKDLIGAMIADGGKAILEADSEVSEAIDFAEYYLRSGIKLNEMEDINWQAKGTILVTPPWNFPVAIPAGGILAALVTGNCVLFKPAPESVLSGWVLVKALWEAGVSKRVLQFINCEDEPVGSLLIADERINAVILTGATGTARLFMKIRNDLDLSAETGGKNAMIITALSDRDLAIKDLIQSAFGHAGQKCSAASLAILEAEVYDDPHFLAQLKDAVESLSVGSPWTLSAKVTPLIREAGEVLYRALTTLESEEKWLVEPKQNPDNPNLWSPGVKLGVKQGSFLHTTECFGPVLSVMRANNLDHAIELANGTIYGLTSGIHSLDTREIKRWMSKIEAGNLYINRSITGAIVQRQPFGGCKASGFGFGVKAGGPSYLYQFVNFFQKSLPVQRLSPPLEVACLIELCEEVSFSAEELGVWYASICSYSFWMQHFHGRYDLDKPEGLSDLVIGQDNMLYYVPRKNLVFRIQKEDSLIDIFRVLAAAILAKVSLEVSWSDSPIDFSINRKEAFPNFTFTQENEGSFLQRMEKGSFERVRLLSSPSEELRKISVEMGCFLDIGAPLANGRWELLHYIREVSISYDYHRYGNLGIREGEKRNPIF